MKGKIKKAWDWTKEHPLVPIAIGTVLGGAVAFVTGKLWFEGHNGILLKFPSKESRIAMDSILAIGEKSQYWYADANMTKETIFDTIKDGVLVNAADDSKLHTIVFVDKLTNK